MHSLLDHELETRLKREERRRWEIVDEEGNNVGVNDSFYQGQTSANDKCRGVEGAVGSSTLTRKKTKGSRSKRKDQSEE
uniref:Uncharacterized protein n=1 Tax=Vespula pensylvanica TaxID=30213 RepID=A0A834JVA4_VESPE|nr:hypothetical protein H0235_016897 [Vespula pensylvanica]